MSGKALPRMLRAMAALKLYSLEENTLVYGELKAYGKALDMVSDFFEKLLQEIFVQKAEDYGLSLLEDSCAIYSNNQSAQTRRQMILEKTRIRQGTFDSKAFRDAFRRISLSILPICVGDNVKISGGQYLNLEQISNLSKLMRDHVSPKTNVFFEYVGHDFDYFEELGKNWNAIDNNAFMFDLIETMY